MPAYLPRVQEREGHIPKTTRCTQAQSPILPEDGNMKTIPISKGYSAIVDDEDYPALIQYRWYALEGEYTVYAIRFEGRKAIRMHRQIMGFPNRKHDVDHQDHCGLHNWRSNLRVCTKHQNHGNTKMINSKRLFKGVRHASAHSWQAGIRHRKQNIYLGSFPTPEEAARAYDKRASKIFGQFALLNFPVKE